MQVQRCVGTGSAFAGANIQTTFTPSGQVTLSWSKAAWEVYKKTFTGETVPFSFTLENAEGKYTFDFPEVQISGDWPDAGNTDIVQVQLDITAANTPPTITRVPTVPATAISVAPATSSGAIGSTVNLTATLTPADSSDTVVWSSSDPAIASVVSTGQKTAQVTRNAAHYRDYNRQSTDLYRNLSNYRHGPLISLTRSAEYRGSGFFMEFLC